MDESGDPTTGDLLCPSGRPEPGSILLGIIGPDGTVGYVQPLIRVDEAFLDRTRRGASATTRFRFAEPCVEADCGYWTGSRCGVIGEVLERQAGGDLPAPADALPHCAIRRSCRWFHQSGPASCRVCPFVVTEVAEDGTMTMRAEIPAEHSEALRTEVPAPTSGGSRPG